MNKKIKSLYNKALEPYTYSDCDGDNNHGIRLNEEKFAELIVKECIMLCEEWIEIDKDLKKTKSWVGVDPEIGPEFCIGSIKNHFGIEE